MRATTPRFRLVPARAVASVHRLRRRYARLVRARTRLRGEVYTDARLKRRLVDALLLILALAVTYAVVYPPNPPPPAASGDGDVTVARAEKWVAAELPAGARVGVDSAVFTGLAGTGRVTARVLAGRTDWHTDTHILSTPVLRDEAARDPALSAVLQSSLPIAVFGRGVKRVEVRQVAPDGAAAFARRWRQDVVDRAVAGIDLLHNPRVQENSSSRAVLLRGGLDLRAVVLVTLLAAQTDVRMIDVTSDPHEAAAHMPARRVAIAITHAAPSLAAVLAMLPSHYQPSTVTVLPRGPRELEWPVAVAPVTSLR
jgi:hypothetical protein